MGTSSGSPDSRRILTAVMVAAVLFVGVGMLRLTTRITKLELELESLVATSPVVEARLPAAAPAAVSAERDPGPPREPPPGAAPQPGGGDAGILEAVADYAALASLDQDTTAALRAELLRSMGQLQRIDQRLERGELDEAGMLRAQEQEILVNLLALRELLGADEASLFMEEVIGLPVEDQERLLRSGPGGAGGAP